MKFSLLSQVKSKLMSRGKLQASPEVCFLHIPKTGGTFIGQLEGNGEPVLAPLTYLGHAIVAGAGFSREHDMPVGFRRAVIIDEEELRGKIVFANVRNIFAFLVSYAHHASGSNPRYRDPTHYDYSPANKGFEYLLKTIADRETPWPSRRLIHFPLFSQPSGQCVVTWINNTASLYETLPQMAQRFGLRYLKRERQRVSEGGKDYRSYYTDSLVDLVLTTWKREIDLFGFRFEDETISRDPEAVVTDLSNINYVWRTDRLSKSLPGSLSLKQ